MYKRIVVPLDGSELAECVLPHAEGIAKGCSTEELILVTVTERIVGSGTKYVTQPTAGVPPLQPVIKLPVSLGRKQKQGERYLNRTANGLRKKGLNVRTEVLLGHPAEEIITFAENNEANLILIASHGRSGISRWVSGSVAERVFRGTGIPVLMVRVPGAVIGT
ncbi:MAG TPA: universal stress protein [Dehalococcoidia bacterium]|nr:universal stress protein [Dehalococcoidia bacterium]